MSLGNENAPGEGEAGQTREHRVAAALVLAVLVAFFAPMLVRGEVSFPHRNDHELGLPASKGTDGASSRRFSDTTLFFVPELHNNLNGSRSSWITTWNPHVELGRPAYQTGGLGRAFFLTRVLSWFESDALRNYTLAGALALALTTLFGFKLFASLGLGGAACFCGAVGLGLGYNATNRVLFVIFLWGLCWTVALLWLVTELFRRRRLWVSGGILIATHCLFVSSYPQQVVWTAYLLIGYTAFRFLKDERSLGFRAGTVGVLALSSLLGAASALPLYLDLYVLAERSSRVGVDAEFFLKVLPRIEDWPQLIRTAIDTFDPNWLVPTEAIGVSQTYSPTPFYASLILIALVTSPPKRFWPILLFAAACIACSYSHEVYRFGISYLGFGFSRFLPLKQLHIPLTVLAAYGVEQGLRGQGRSRWFAAAAMLAIPCLLCLLALLEHLTLRPAWVATGCGLVLGTVAFLRAPRSWWVVLLSVLSAFLYGYPLLMKRPREDVQTTSPLVEAIRRHTEGGSRFAFVRSGLGFATPEGLIRVIGPNTEAWVGLRSIHTYNSLSSRAYQDWALRFNRQELPSSYGRRFSDIKRTTAMSQTDFRLSGVGLALSPSDPGIAGASSVRRAGNLELYRLDPEPLLQAVFEDFTRVGPGSIRIEEAELTRAAEVQRVRDEGDRIVLGFEPRNSESLLFVSQQHHPDWRATSEGRVLETVMVNDLYQGVVVPVGADAVELEFRPWVRWIWLAQLLFLVGAAVVLVRALRRSRRGAAAVSKLP